MKYTLLLAFGVRALAELQVIGYIFELKQRTFFHPITDGVTQEIDLGGNCRVKVSVVDQSVLITALEDNSFVYNPNSCKAIDGATSFNAPVAHGDSCILGQSRSFNLCGSKVNLLFDVDGRSDGLNLLHMVSESARFKASELSESIKETYVQVHRHVPSSEGMAASLPDLSSYPCKDPSYFEDSKNRMITVVCKGEGFAKGMVGTLYPSYSYCAGDQVHCASLGDLKPEIWTRSIVKYKVDEEELKALKKYNTNQLALIPRFYGTLADPKESRPIAIMEFLLGENLREYLFSDRLWEEFLIAPSEQSSAAVTRKINCVVNKVFKSMNAILDAFGEYSIDFHPGNVMVLIDEEGGGECPDIRQIDFHPVERDPSFGGRILRELQTFTNSIREQLLTIEIASRGGLVPWNLLIEQEMYPPRADLFAHLMRSRIAFNQYEVSVNIAELEKLVDRFKFSDDIPFISSWGRLLGQGLHVIKDTAIVDDGSIPLPEYKVSADAKPFTEYIESIDEDQFNCLFVKILKLMFTNNRVARIELDNLVVSSAKSSVLEEVEHSECPDVLFARAPRSSSHSKQNVVEGLHNLLYEAGLIEAKKKFKPLDNFIKEINEILAENPSGPKFAARNATLYCPSWTFTLKQLIYKKITGVVIEPIDCQIVDKIARALSNT